MTPNVEPNPTQEPRNAVEEDCGECDLCIFIAYDPENPDTHCINCTCFLCIPGN